MGAGQSVIENRRGAGQEAGLPQLLEALRWRWKPTVLIALVFTVAATIYVESLPAEYDGEALVAIGPRPEVPSAGADTVRVVAPKYVAYVTARSTIEEVAPTIGEDPSDLDSALDASVGTDTGNITITVRLRSPERAAKAANAFAEKVVAFSVGDPLLRGELVARALPPDTPAAPPRRLLEAAALIVGLLLGTGVSVLLERGRPRLRSWREISGMTGYPVVGRVPHSGALRSRPKEAFADPITGSAFRSLRANIEPQLREQKLDLIIVTSPAKGDGKTTVAALFAESLARVDMKVLLIDADLRRPRLASLANVDGTPGLSTVLRQVAALEAGIQAGWSENLSLLPTSPDPDGGDLIATRFAEVVAEAKRTFDVVVVDTPPLLGTDEARPLLSMAKGVLLVVTAGARADEVNEAVLAVEALHAPLLGIVGNRLRESRSAYYY